MNKATTEYFGIVYRARNKINRKCYVGQTTKILKERRREHLSILQSKEGRYFQHALYFYGPENFEWETIKVCNSKEELDYWEVYYIDLCNSFWTDFGYNLTRGGDGMHGYHHTKETLKKISESLKGKPSYERTEEIRKQLSEIHKEICKNQILTPEYHKRLSKAQQVCQRTPEARKKQHDSHMGLKPTLETREKRSKTLMGHVVTEETRKRMREGWEKKKRKKNH
jgi:group I intron endonuclease